MRDRKAIFYRFRVEQEENEVRVASENTFLPLSLRANYRICPGNNNGKWNGQNGYMGVCARRDSDGISGIDQGFSLVNFSGRVISLHDENPELASKMCFFIFPEDPKTP